MPSTQIPADVRMAFRQAAGAVAERLGITFEEATRLPRDQFDDALRAMIGEAQGEIRENARNVIRLRRLDALFRKDNVPAGITVGEAVEAGYMTLDQISDCDIISDEEIDAELARTGHGS